MFGVHAQRAPKRLEGLLSALAQTAAPPRPTPTAAEAEHQEGGNRDGPSSMFALRPDEVAQFWADGFYHRPAMFTAAEAAALAATAKADPLLMERSHEQRNEEGVIAMSAMNWVGTNWVGAVARCGRIVDSVEAIFGGAEIYHYHSKVMLKDARVGGPFQWHQDFGYWYHNSVPGPDMLSVMVALDTHTRENGCLEVLQGSHKMGRLDMVTSGDQAYSDPARVEWAQQHCDHRNVLCAPGDTFFMHCNTLHASAPNRSGAPRWALICCFNTRANSPSEFITHPPYTPHHRWNDARVLELASTCVAEGDGTVFTGEYTAADHFGEAGRDDE